MEDYSTIKRNEVLIHVATWLNPTNVKFKKPNPKAWVTCFYLYEMSRIGKFIETENRLVVAWG